MPGWDLAPGRAGIPTRSVRVYYYIAEPDAAVSVFGILDATGCSVCRQGAGWGVEFLLTVEEWVAAAAGRRRSANDVPNGGMVALSHRLHAARRSCRRTGRRREDA